MFENKIKSLFSDDEIKVFLMFSTNCMITQRNRRIFYEKFVITIGREYGSGGRIIGEKLAKRLGVNFYDKNMIDKIAEESGFTKEAVEALDGKKTSSFLYSLLCQLSL